MKRWLVVAWEEYEGSGELRNILIDFHEEPEAIRFRELYIEYGSHDPRRIVVIDRDAYDPQVDDCISQKILKLM